jgi:hypothetical protein
VDRSSIIIFAGAAAKKVFPGIGSIGAGSGAGLLGLWRVWIGQGFVLGCPDLCELLLVGSLVDIAPFRSFHSSIIYKEKKRKELADISTQLMCYLPL